ncbi:MAG: hypothetical protein MJY52_04120 [Bacteroidaceae bacterium]|nr:hypothetical protein [Bacteroidaceae bacterium]
MKKFFAIVALMLSVMTVNAQNNEVYIQINPSTLHADGADGFSPFGLAAGYNRLFGIGCEDNLKLIAGGKFSYSWKSENGADWSFMKIAIPVSVGYHFQAGKIGIMPFAGIDCSFYPLAKLKINGESGNLFDEDEVGELLKASRLQIGGHIGVDADYKNFVLGVAYQSDFTKFQDNTIMSGSEGVKCKTYFSEFEIKLGYRF